MEYKLYQKVNEKVKETIVGEYDSLEKAKRGLYIILCDITYDWYGAGAIDKYEREDIVFGALSEDGTSATLRGSEYFFDDYTFTIR